MSQNAANSTFCNPARIVAWRLAMPPHPISPTRNSCILLPLLSHLPRKRKPAEGTAGFFENHCIPDLLSGGQHFLRCRRYRVELLGVQVDEVRLDFIALAQQDGRL